MNAIAKLAALIEERCGMRMGTAHVASVSAAVERLRHGGPEAVLHGVTGEGGDRLLQRLIDDVTVKETSFLRDPRQLATIDWPSLLEGANRRGARRARVWSAACSTGEEPYTLAILATEAFGGDRPPVEILGTDIATPALDEARRGRYDARALRNLDARLVERHFSVESNGHVVAPQLREIVSFRQHNLAQDTSPPAGEAPFDLILCRNVLIYLEPAVVERVVAELKRALAPRGTLVLGAADRLCVARPAVEPVAFRIARRGARSAATPAVAPSEAIRERGPARPSAPASARTLADDRSEAAERLVAAVQLADAGHLQNALDAAAAALREDPMNAAAHFVRGSAELAGGNAGAAVDAFRRALYADGAFGAAAFQLGRAYDALEREADARDAYQRALRTLDAASTRHAWLLGHVDIGDLAAACRVRLRGEGLGVASRHPIVSRVPSAET